MSDNIEQNGNTFKPADVRDFWRRGQALGLLDLLQARAWDTERHSPQEIRDIIRGHKALRATWRTLAECSIASMRAWGPDLRVAVATKHRPGDFSTPADIVGINKAVFHELGIVLPGSVHDLLDIADNAEGPYFVLLETTPKLEDQVDGIGSVSYVFSADDDEVQQYEALSALDPTYIPTGYSGFSGHKLYFDSVTGGVSITDEAPTTEETDMVVRLAGELQRNIQALY